MKYDELTNQQKIYVDAIAQWSDDSGHHLNKDIYSRAELRLVSLGFKGSKWIPNWITHDQSRRLARGEFQIPEVTQRRQVVAGSIGTEDRLEPAVMDATEVDDVPVTV